MSQVFYRKYRPKNFGEMVGQEGPVKILKNALKEKKVGHAYLFSGPRGTGKTTVARILAGDLGCAPEDINEIDAASSRGIDEARALRDAVRFLPLNSPYKVYIIDEVHMLTKEAFNALLKTLEEPPEHAIFILATTELGKVPDTVVSRTQHLEFKKISVPDISRELKRISQAENIKSEDAALKLMAFFADGSLRDAENILYQVAGAAQKPGVVSEEDVREILGAPKEEAVNGIIKAMLGKDRAKMLELFDKIVDGGVNPELLNKLLIRSARACLFLALDFKTESILEHEFSKEDLGFFKECAAYGVKPIGGALRELLEALRAPADDFMPQLPLELALIKASFIDKG